MNLSDRVSENTKGRFRTVIGICVGCLFLGTFFGFLLDAQFRPNRILLYINADGKVSLSPKPRDIIYFEAFNEGTGAKVEVNYTANITPCDPSVSPPTCVYRPFTPDLDVYLFGCTSKKTNADGTVEVTNCSDPQYGPKCTKCPGGGIQKGKFLLSLLILAEEFGEDLKELFRFSPAERILTENLGGPYAPSPPMVHPSSVIEVAAKCDGNAPAVYPSGSSTSTTTIPARLFDTITWNSYDPNKGYKITDLNVCKQQDQPSSDKGKNRSCTIKDGSSTSITYKLWMTCNNNPQSYTLENIALP